MEFYAPELDAADLDDAADLTGADMPSPSAYLSAQQKNGKTAGGRHCVQRNMALAETAWL